MDKNENGSPAQFSPEELIRRLKSQLNINTEQPAEDTEKVPDEEEIVETAVEGADEANGVFEDVEEINAETVEVSEADADDSVDEDNDGISVTAYDENTSDEDVSEDIDYEDTPDEDSPASEALAGDSTVEFSISDLFGTQERTEDAVEEIVSVEASDSADAPADAPAEDFDFLSFLTASGISAAKQDVEDEQNDKACDEDEPLMLDEIAEELSVDVEPAIETEACVETDEVDLADIDADSSAADPEAEAALTAVDEPASADDEIDTSAALEAATETSVEAVDSAEDDQLDYSFVGEDTPDSDDDTDEGGESKALPDFNMLIALAIPVAEVEKIYGAEAAAEYTRLTDGTNVLDPLSDEEEEYEYTSRSQNEEIEAHHRSEKKLSFVKICAAAVLFILALLYENMPALGAEYSGWMDQSAFPVVHIMADLQLVLFAAVLAWDEIVSGIKALLRRTANVGTVVAAAVIINVICDIGLCFTRVAKYEVKLAGAPVIFAVLMCITITAIRLFVEVKAFDMVSRKGTRSCVLTESIDDVRERNAFFDKISKEDASSAKVLSFGKTSFVSGFFRNQTANKATVVDKILAPAALVGAIVAAVIAYAVSESIGIALYTLNCSAAFLLPVSAFAAGTLTYAKAASFAEGMKAAIIGESAPYELADSSVVAFEDRDAYPSYCVKLRNLKVYGNIAIVDVLRMTTTAFRKIGGPLSDVLESATSEVNKDIPVDIVKSCESGIEAVYQGQRLLIGKADFLHSYGIIPYSDVDDREYLKTGDVSIMYVAYGEELSAKFYIQYTLDVDFEVLLRDLNRAGICVSIRTSDPNIDKRLLQAKLNLNKTSLRIVYREPADGRSEPAEETVSAVIGTGTPSELIHTAMLCDRVVHVYRTNTIVKALSLLIGFALLVLFALISVNVNVFSGLLIIYQLFWMIPTLVVSKLFL